MSLIFISDLHLSPATEDKNQVFYQLLASWRGNISGLYILGDFFDYWVGDDDDNPFIREMRHNLQQFSQLTPIYFRGGNHDFAVGKRFARQTGMQLIKDMHTLSWHGQTILLSHGDTFCSLDLGYQKMKRIFQNRWLIFLLLRLPLRWRYRLKQSLEQKSHASANSQPEHTYQVVNDTIAEYAATSQANIIIHGHTHRPGHYHLTGAAGQQLERYELPDWQDHPAGGYLRLDQGGFSYHQGN